MWKTDALFHANNLVTAVDVTTDDGRKLAFAFPDERKPVEMKLGGAPVKQLRLAIASVKKSKDERQLHPRGRPSRCPARRSSSSPLIARRRSRRPSRKLRGVLQDCDEAALRAHLRFPFTIKPPNAEGEKPTHTSYASAKELAKACKKQRLWGTEGAFDQMNVWSDAPNTITIGNYPDAWTLVLDGGAWKLVAIEDNSV